METDSHGLFYDRPGRTRLPGAVASEYFDVTDNGARGLATLTLTSSDHRTTHPSSGHGQRNYIDVISSQLHNNYEPSLVSPRMGEAGERGSASARLVYAVPQESPPHMPSAATPPAFMAWNPKMYNLEQDQSSGGVYETDVDAMLLNDTRSNGHTAAKGYSATYPTYDLPQHAQGGDAYQYPACGEPFYDLAQPGAKGGIHSSSSTSSVGGGEVHYDLAKSGGDVYYQIPTADDLYEQAIYSPASNTCAMIYQLPSDHNDPGISSSDGSSKVAWCEGTYYIDRPTHQRVSIAQLIADPDPNALVSYCEPHPLGSVSPSADGTMASSRGASSSVFPGPVHFKQGASKKKRRILWCMLAALILAGIIVPVILFMGGTGSNSSAQSSTSPSEELANTGFGNALTTAALGLTLTTTPSTSTTIAGGGTTAAAAANDTATINTLATTTDVPGVSTASIVTTAMITTTTTTTTVVDCTVAAWSAWQACPVSCGGGLQTRSRSILISPANGGASCPPLSASQSCNTQGCPVDCTVPGWSSWSGCSVSCGGGTQTRTRTITTQPAYGGAGCLSLSDAQSCNTQGCLVDCAVSTWSSWTSCSLSCGTGTQTKTRTITAAAANGGAGCPALLSSRSCNTQGCPVNCIVSGWSGWSGCTVSCGGGTQTRTRTITTQPAYGGAGCPALTSSVSCNTQGCPVNCVVSGWSGWSGCTVTCGGGTRTHTRTITTQPANGGTGCPALTGSQSCNTQSCPSWSCVSNTDYWGADVVGGQNAASLSDCKNMCLARSGCGALTVAPNGAAVTCYLKSATGWAAKYTAGDTSCKLG